MWALIPAAAAAMAGQVESPVIRVTVNLVQVDAVVTDSKGRQVTDLKPEDFEIIEDGRPQKITNFSYIRLARPPGATPAPETTPLRRSTVPPPPVMPAAAKREEVRRTIVLVVDDLGLSFESMGGVRHDLKQFVEQQVQPGDLVAIVRTSGGMGALDQFTTDRRLLAAAVERLRWYPAGRGGLSAESGVSRPGMDQEARNQEAQWRRISYSLGTLGAVSYLVNGMRDMPGRKSLILISDGLRLRSALGPAETIPRRYSAPTAWEQDERMAEALRRLADQANRAAVVLYSVDARGILTLAPSADDPRTLEEIRNASHGDPRLTSVLLDQEGLGYVAHETGGFLAPPSNRIDFSIGKILQDLEGYYLIGYKPDPARFHPRHGEEVDFHAIKVRVKVPGLHVRSRSGYYGFEDKPRPPQDQLAAAMFSPFQSSGVRLRLTPVFTEATNSRATITLMLHIDARDLTFVEKPDGTRAADADLIAFTVDESGRPVDKASYKAVVGLKRGDDEAVRAGLLYTSSIPVTRPGPYHVRVAVRDTATGRIGTAGQFIEVPDLKKRRLALSGLVLSSPAGQRHDAEAPGAAAFRVFRRGATMDFSCQIFNAHLDRKTKAAVVETEVRVFQGQKEVLSTGSRRLEIGTGSASTTAKGALPLTSFEPGSYVLQFIVRDKLAKEKHGVADQWTDFDVAP